MIGHVDDEHPQVGAHIALAGGALVEHGASPTELGRALVAPLERALVDAARMVAYAKQYGHEHAHEHADDDGDVPPDDPDVPDDDEDDEAGDHGEAGDHRHEHDHGEGHAHALEIGGWALTDEQLETIAARDVAAVRAWASLEMWYRPAVAAWSRDLSVLREVQARSTLRAAIDALAGETATTHWLSVLLAAVASAPFVVLVPELEEAWAFTADGVVDMGQLTVLLSKALADPLARLGASGPATEAELDVMSGAGPQSSDGGYSSSFAFYPIEAADPTTGLPRDGIYEWTAPGGTGTHSLPGDFLPGTIAPRDGVRQLVMVGPKAPGLRFVRIISSSRMFDALGARISDVRKLPSSSPRGAVP
ncbi:MAG: hypothetical protein IPQ07_01440 [Myxococcales bacterium]|nr:hypothetical protein [Myxococcales bacterium]